MPKKSRALTFMSAQVGTDIFAQECLMRRMRGIGLVLIDKGRDAIISVGRLAREHHEIAFWMRWIIQRIIWLERDVYFTIAALCDKIKAMIKELAKDCQQRVIGR
jgi:hypothetical protein